MSHKIILKSAAEYEGLAMVTAAPLPEAVDHFTHAAVGLASELGELVSALRAFEGAVGEDAIRATKVNVLEEIGDHFWYIALATAHEPVHPHTFHPLLAGALTTVTSRADQEHLDGLTASVAAFCDGVKRWRYYKRDYGVLAGPIRGAIVDSMVHLGGLACHYSPRAHEGPASVVRAVLETNLNKLAKRYGPKFSEHFANNRDLKSEFCILADGLS